MVIEKSTRKANRQELKALYETQVIDGINRWKTIYGQDTPDEHGFLLWAFDLILDEFDVDITQEQNIQACQLDRSWDLKIDAGYIDRETETIFLVQSKNWDSTKLVGDQPFFQTWEALDLLTDEGRIKKANRYTRGFYAEFAPAVQAGYRIVLALATSGRVTNDQESYVANKPKVRDVNIGETTYPVNIRFEIFGLERLIETEARGSDEPATESEFPVTLHFDSGYYDLSGEGGGLYESVYATISGQELIELRRTLREGLYKLNYRAPLDSRVAINQGIFTTLRDIPHLFHILNNGITAICERFEIDHDSKTAQVWGIQVVNGCQTSETLFRNSEKVIGHPEVKVNFRLIACYQSQASLIATATNQQTKLRAEDFVTLDSIHDELQRQFANMTPHPWYYEIKRRYWKTSC